MDGRDLPEESEESLRTAVRMAVAFDRGPIFTLENVIFLNCAEKQGVYDETGATAIEGLINSLEEIHPLVSDAFRVKFSREMEAVNGRSI